PATAPSADRSRGAAPARSSTVPAVVAAPEPSSSHVPRFIGELGLNTRIMFAKRSGRPRSFTRSAGLAFTAPVAISAARRASTGFPKARARRANVDDAPASPPVKRYQPISPFHTGAFRIGRP